jgi:hypothetical protein
VLFQHHHQPVHRAFVELQRRTQFRQAAIARALCQYGQSRQSPVEDLHLVRRIACLILWHAYHIMELLLFVKKKNRLSLSKMLSGANAFEISDSERMNLGAQQPGAPRT